MYDPFRVQFLTISLDTEVVLAFVGVIVAGLVSRAQARRLGAAAADLWDSALDVALWTVVGARLGWVAAHPGYFVSAPIQVVAVGDGGFLFGTGELGALYGLWRTRSRLALSWPQLGSVAAPAIAAALLLDRAGCALTACGGGQATNVPWAIVRSGATLHPVGLYSLGVWMIAFVTLSRDTQASKAWPILLVALVVERGLVATLGFEGSDGLMVSAALLAVLLVTVARRAWYAHRSAYGTTH